MKQAFTTALIAVISEAIKVRQGGLEEVALGNEGEASILVGKDGEMTLVLTEEDIQAMNEDNDDYLDLYDDDFEVDPPTTVSSIPSNID